MSWKERAGIPITKSRQQASIPLECDRRHAVDSLSFTTCFFKPCISRRLSGNNGASPPHRHNKDSESQTFATTPSPEKTFQRRPNHSGGKTIWVFSSTGFLVCGGREPVSTRATTFGTCWKMLFVLQGDKYWSCHQWHRGRGWRTSHVNVSIVVVVEVVGD